MSVTPAALDLIESLSEFQLPERAVKRLQDLMDRNNDGKLSTSEYAELESLVELTQEMSLLRARALHILGRTPK